MSPGRRTDHSPYDGDRGLVQVVPTYSTDTTITEPAWILEMSTSAS
jgi:hypothetical protein